jgi:hypothetical protein
MAKPDEYRKYAADAVRLASGGSTSAETTRLLVLAERWLDLADAEDERSKADHRFRIIEEDDRRRVSEEHQKGE